MANEQQVEYPTLQVIMDLARSFVNDMYPGIAGVNGRILTNAAPFTIPYVNEALRQVNRKLRNEGVTYPIKDNVILNNLTPVPVNDTSIQVFVGFDGYFDGVTMHATPLLPSDLMQPLQVWEQTVGSNLPFTLMGQPEAGLTPQFQGAWLSQWEWRQYRIYMPGSNQAKNLRLRYLSGQPPFNTIPANFGTTPVFIIDCESAMAAQIAIQYGQGRGASPQALTDMKARFDEAIDDMALEWVRRSQGINYRRPAYNGGGSNDTGTPVGPVGQTQGA